MYFIHTLHKPNDYYTHLTDDTSISQELKYPDQLDPEDVTTPASLHVLRVGECGILTRDTINH